jgi:hypothetical protein
MTITNVLKSMTNTKPTPIGSKVSRSGRKEESVLSGVIISTVTGIPVVDPWMPSESSTMILIL